MKMSTAPLAPTLVRVAVALVCALFGAGPGVVSASAQTTVVVAGVADANTGAPLEGAQIRLPDIGVIARTNWIGEATIKNVPRGARRIQVRKLGYSPSDIDLMVSGDSTGPVFMLAPSVTTLDAVRVEAEWYPRRMEEFFSRRKLGIGRFLSDSVLAKEGNREMNVVLSMRLPGIRAIWIPKDHRYQLVSTRGPGTIKSGSIDLYCPVDVYLDGMFFFEPDLDRIDPSELAGVEMYSMSSAPPQYRRSTGSCSVLLLWSKF